jgi:hypothetical protein
VVSGLQLSESIPNSLSVVNVTLVFSMESNGPSSLGISGPMLHTAEVEGGNGFEILTNMNCPSFAPFTSLFNSVCININTTSKLF